jgi:SAM-dependent methyltransferase
MMEKGAARKGGMPLYKWLGNRVLTRVENRMLGTTLTEFHSGYRAYRVDALEAIPFEGNTDDFHFDTQIIVQLHDAGRRIAEVPIPTYYGDEICHVNGMKYAKDVVAEVVRYRLQKRGLGAGDRASVGPDYQLKASADSSHGRIVARLARERPGRVLDLGCAGGHVAEQLRDLGHLEAGIPDSVGYDFDVVVCADVVEHTRAPEALLADAGRRLRPGGMLLASIPNFAHWYPRLRVAAGAFDYDQRGILDATHLRFFTRSSFQRLARRAGWEARRVDAVGIPFDVVRPGGGRSAAALARVDRALVRLYPKLFAYQFLFELAPAAGAAHGGQRQAPDAGQQGGGGDGEPGPETGRQVAHLHH